jgi:hypothetical protein
LDPSEPGKALISAEGLPPTQWDVLGYSHTGRDGRIYVVNREGGYVQRYEPPTTSSSRGKWTVVAGAGGVGICADTDANEQPILATQCKMDIQDIYVTANSDIYIVDRGRIRTISDSGTMITLFGQGYSYGDSKLAVAARFGSLASVDQFITSDGQTEVIAIDSQESRIRSFKIGQNIQTILGNGIDTSIKTSVLMNDPSQTINTTQVSSLYDNFAVDPTTGDIYVGQSARIYRLNRSNNPGKVEILAGGGSNKYFLASSDGKVGTQVGFSIDSNSPIYYPIVFGFGNGQVASLIGGYSKTTGGRIENYIKLYSASNGVQTSLAGNSSVNNSFCSNGSSLVGCGVPTAGSYTFPKATYLPATSTQNASWLMIGAVSSSNKIRQLTVGGNISTFVTASQAMRSFAYREIAATSGSPAKNVIYYCGTNDGRLYSRVVSPTPTTPDTQLPWSITNLKCTGKTLLYNPVRKSLIFPASQNQMSLIMEYLLDR